jgi:hypothetical protein
LVVIEKKTIHAVTRSFISIVLAVGIWQYGDALSSVDTFWVKFVDAP